ncbi:ribonuclease J [Candidatus Falkowbacteria bacterium]|nr:ribonuclease J [Candidatus Falkowbacteria bacterium]
MIKKYKPFSQSSRSAAANRPSVRSAVQSSGQPASRPSARPVGQPAAQSAGRGGRMQPRQPLKTNRRFISSQPKVERGLAQDNKLKIIFLGGLEEIGRNMTIFEYEEDIIIVDMGLQFPEEDMPGIDYIIPNTAYLENKINKIRGVIITHGHYDHIGAIPHLMGKLGNPPIYTGALTAGIINRRQTEFKEAPKLNIVKIVNGSKMKMGRNFEVEFCRVTHSIPDSFAPAISTPAGLIFYTGDFKFDHSPINDEPADLNRIASIGGRGVLALISDSTGADSPGYQISESKVGEDLNQMFERAPGRIIIGTFASLLSRVQQIITISEKFGRKVFPQGRSISQNIEIAQELGYFKMAKGTLINENEFRRLPRSKVTVICTGAQGEKNAALQRIASGEHRFVSILPDDMIIFSSSVVPGNERSVQALKDNLYRQGGMVFHYDLMDIHAGGHAKQEDLKLMIRLLKPKYFIPNHGHHYMLRVHGELAKGVGVDPNNVLIADNGQEIEFLKTAGGTMGRLGKDKAITDYVMVDGMGVGDVSNIVLRDRRVMSEDGMIVVIATIDSRTGEPIGNPDIISRGFVYMKENKRLIENTRMKVKNIVKAHDARTPADDDHIKNKIRNDIGQFLFTKTKRRPMVLPVVIKV